MDDKSAYRYFYDQKWPGGYRCPRCGHRECTTISTRRLPLYQCGLCKHQTTLTAGTVMERSRTPLGKWAQAIELLSSTGGVNVVQLSAAIRISYKSAWGMLRSFRRAISNLEASRRLDGYVRAGLEFLGPRYFLLYVHQPRQHAVVIGASVDHLTGEPVEIKLHSVPRGHLNGMKRLTREGKDTFFERHVDPCSISEFVPYAKMNINEPLYQCFQEARRWLSRLFHGLGAASLQSYLDEYCFRWNGAKLRMNQRQQWLDVCFLRAERKTPPLRAANICPDECAACSLFGIGVQAV
ncbi:IS1595 family transposase [Paenibacillus sp.]|uniref:IS1595 family transposase n=1 Tax=Paenibacillus sp. TaxID=58172 RepID=UPI002D26EDA8|nr:IS1595 family transposase [Paenibacillus sp.]HZG86623.1 IS1595 family transposase [Paenibacillus sp.]